MVTRADFDKVMTDLFAAIKAAALRCSGSGFAFTDQDLADLKQNVADVNAIGGGAPPGGSVKLAISPSLIPPSAQAAAVLTLAAPATSDQVWVLSATPADVLVFPPTATVFAGSDRADFKVTAGAPVADTPCTINATFAGQTATAVCTVQHA